MLSKPSTCNIVLCSECFQRHGIKIMAERFGTKDGTKCPFCGSDIGAKLSMGQVRQLAETYIVDGSYWRTVFGGAPIYMLSDSLNDGECFEDDPDLKLLESVSGTSACLYGPALWRIGMITWLEELQSNDNEVRRLAINKLIENCEKKEIQKGAVFFRLLSKLYGDVHDPLTFDSPHWKYQKKGRFSIPRVSVLYLSTGIESTIHEGRVTIEDELSLASFSVEQPLNILDLTTTHYASSDPFEDLSRSLSYLFSAGEKSYSITQAIAQVVYKQGFDGILYDSYFKQISSLNDKNLALFGHPIKDGKVRVISIDRLLLNKVEFSYSLGVLLPNID